MKGYIEYDENVAICRPGKKASPVTDPVTPALLGMVSV